jgi:4'-phosphopantetheinyl transferase
VTERPTAARAHLYAIVLEDTDDDGVRARCEGVLSADERARWRGFVFQRNRREFLYAHALLRFSLSRHAPTVPPAAWTFVAEPRGRPLICGPAASALHFSLSHADGLLACVIAGEPSVGVDVEATDRGRDTMALAERYFAPHEVEVLRGLPSDARRDRFFRYWTLKESYLKARGIGLGMPLDAFWFTFDGTGGVRIAFRGGVEDWPGRWRFIERRPSARHRLAVAMASRTAADWTLDLVEEVSSSRAVSWLWP